MSKHFPLKFPVFIVTRLLARQLRKPVSVPCRGVDCFVTVFISNNDPPRKIRINIWGGGSGVDYLTEKRLPAREANHSSKFNTEIKIVWICTFSSPKVLLS